MDAGSLISKKDWATIRQALEDEEEITLERELGKVRVSISTALVTGAAKTAWNSKILVGAEVKIGGFYIRQWFPSAEEAKHHVRSWTYG